LTDDTHREIVRAVDGTMATAQAIKLALIAPPPLAETPVGEAEATRKLGWYLAHAITYLQGEGIIQLPSMRDDPMRWAHQLRDLYDGSGEFRDVLATTMMSMMEGDAQAQDVSGLLLVEWLDGTGGFGNYEDVQEWLMEKLEGIKGGGKPSGSWRAKVAIATHLIPFCAAHLPEEIPATLFYDSAIIDRLRPAVPLLIGSKHAPGVIRDASRDIEEKKEIVMKVLGMATEPDMSRTKMREKLYSQSKEKVPAYEVEWCDLRTRTHHRELRIVLPMGSKGDSWRASIMRQAGRLIDLKGLEK
jgi:hypothetical protein